MAAFDASLRGLHRLGSAPVSVPRPRDDASLVRAARSGSAEAWGELFERHWTEAFRAAQLIVHDAAAAEDIAQEAFLSALAALDRFDRRRPFAPWLHRIVVNRAIDHARARTRRGELPADGGPE
ncbi:MAG: polymerase, sigma-24 subunit, subfamily, partial [Solirubrobacterales bacterium]|nr:polymerase, sigma-24 subunit, subfamily [Solirubrobacterales bacterium]